MDLDEHIIVFEFCCNESDCRNRSRRTVVVDHMLVKGSLKTLFTRSAQGIVQFLCILASVVVLQGFTKLLQWVLVHLKPNSSTPAINANLASLMVSSGNGARRTGDCTESHGARVGASERLRYIAFHEPQQLDDDGHREHIWQCIQHWNSCPHYS